MTGDTLPMSTEFSIAHKTGMNRFGAEEWPDGRVPWREARAPVVSPDEPLARGRLRSCAYCGSMHPADVANAIRAGAKGDWADWKYGWPHKAYFESIPNPHAGLLEVGGMSPTPYPRFPRKVAEQCYSSASGKRLEDKVWYTEEPHPAPSTTNGKFYSVHLEDATLEDRELIEAHLGIFFDFHEPGRIGWRKSKPENEKSAS